MLIILSKTNLDRDSENDTHIQRQTERQKERQKEREIFFSSTVDKLLLAELQSTISILSMMH